MRQAHGVAAALAAAPFGALFGWLRMQGYFTPAPQAAWMLFWLCAALLVWLLALAMPTAPPAAADAWQASKAPQSPLCGLGPCLFCALSACLGGTLCEVSLQLNGLAAAILSGGVAAAAAWLLLCLIALACAWHDCPRPAPRRDGYRR